MPRKPKARPTPPPADKPRRGRPPSADSRTIPRMVRLSLSEAEAQDAAAAREDRTWVDWVRDLANKANERASTSPAYRGRTRRPVAWCEVNRLNRHVGRAVREAMRPDPPGAAEERIRYRKAGEQANREMMERFSPLTADNAGDAIKWQEARIRELLSGAK